MQCCGPLQDITSQTDRMPVYLCGECGKQGHASAFPDPVEAPPPPLTKVQRIRLAVAKTLDRIAGALAPE